MKTDEWVLVVQNSACCTYQILDETTTTTQKQPRWLRLAKRAIAFGCSLYGIPLQL